MILLAVVCLGWYLACVHANRLELTQNGKPYLTRWHLWRWGFKVFVHRIHSKDHDRDPHNHPWPWAVSLILLGWYDELRCTSRHGGLCGICSTVPTEAQKHMAWTFSRVRWLNFIGPNTYHRILEVAPRTWTLFLAGPRSRTWGFWTEQGHVPYSGPALND